MARSDIRVSDNRQGVYAIRNSLNGCCYFGSTVSWYQRSSRHKLELRKGIHHCQHLQRAWVKYGESAFDFIFIAEVEAGCLFAAEQACLDIFQNKYNTGQFAGMAFLGRRHSDESRKKMSASLKGKPLSEATKEKLRQANLGKPIPPAVRVKISRALLGRTFTREHAAKLRGPGYWWNVREQLWQIRIHHNKRELLHCFCLNEQHAAEVVRVVRAQADASQAIDVPKQLVARFVGKRFSCKQEAA